MSLGAPYPLNEAKRQIRVADLCLLDSTPDETFDQIVALAAAYFQVPIALISIIDGGRQWFRSTIGLSVSETPRRDSFCAYAILADEFFEVCDATQDERFFDNPLVSGSPGIRYYAAYPLITGEGFGLGSLCIIDTNSRAAMNKRDRAMLEGFARLVMHRIFALRSLSYIDSPTGLFNRARLQADIGEGLDAQMPSTLVSADLISPKFLNDIVKALGYDFAIQLIIAIRDRLHVLLPAGCKLYKIGPTRFAFLCPAQVNFDIEDLLDRIVSEFQSPLECLGIPIQMQAGLGVLALIPGESEGQDWLRLVASSSDEARERGIGWMRYQPLQDFAQQRAFSLLQALSEAICAPDQFRLEYQPRIDLATGRCVSVEALLRWTHPQLGAVGPGEFIPLAEKTALMAPLSRWVMRTAIEQAARWQREQSGLKISVNVSAAEMGSAEFVDTLLSLLAEQGVNPTGFEVEFTESAFISNPQEVRRQLERLRASGVDVAIDDFGTGYSNWSYLRDLPANTVKIDQSFTRYLVSDSRDQRLVQTIISLAKGLGYRVVAEGVETKATLELLRQWGCDEGQGYFFAKPMSANAIQAWLARASSQGEPFYFSRSSSGTGGQN